ncbi:MAG: RnfABCDGE type electron transport complex subunit D [Spirochaetes bacterium]|nr:RnfABCDGE type electron transport complex subunit D [Spirochaetota bacterium]
MEKNRIELIISVSPHLKKDISIQKIMLIVILSLIPTIIISILFFGIKVFYLYITAITFAILTEILVKIIRKQNYKSFFDLSSIITALLLVMSLPPTISWQKVALGAFISILIGKEIFGGIGSNIWNPALVGRAFLSAAYPASLAANSYINPNNIFKFLEANTTSASKTLDAVSSATPLALSKFDKTFTPLLKLFIGQVGGSIGETSALTIILGGIILLSLKIINIRMVLSYIGTVFILTGIMHLIDPSTYASPFFHIFAGGLMLGAFYMATDMVTTPFTNKGIIIFGVGAGLLVFLIRIFGGYPEGVMFSILIMNSFTPLINKYSKLKTFGS